MPLLCRNLPPSPSKLRFFPFLPIYLFVMIFALPVSLFYTPNACTFPLFSLFNPPHSPCPPLTAASLCCLLPLLFLRLSAPSPFCRLALLLSRLFVASFFCRFTLSPLFLFSFTASHKTAAGKSCCFFRLPFLPALQSDRRSVFAAIVCPMILRTDQFVPAPFTRKFVIRLPFPTKRRSLSYVLSLLGL